jgi:alpha-beta hydrolase superfamily lysophospholipase
MTTATPPAPAAEKLSRARERRWLRRLVLLATTSAALAGCVANYTPRPPRSESLPPDEVFTMPDGARLPVRTWLPDGEPWAVMLALHGFNDSRDAWEIPAPAFTEAGIAVFAPDQRGFGGAPDRGHWPTGEALVEDARVMAGLLRQRYPRARLYLMGESMGAAVLMAMAEQPDPPPAAGYIFLAPAVWGRAEMNMFLRAGLWLASTFVPGVTVTGQEVPLKISASDNRDALIRLSRDALTLHRTRFDTLRGLVDLMDEALAAAPNVHVPSLFLYGGQDDFVPKQATAATWRALPATAREAFYPAGHHLLLRDLDRDELISDIIAWMHTPAAPLPSHADEAARAWLATQP